jgi:hypothetical protein
MGVVVQRQVGIGVGSPAQRPPAPVPRRRPAQPIPYVVKEGTHPTFTQSHPSPPRPTSPMMPPPVPPPNPAAARASAPAEDVVSDKSLDEVILAYLSQGDSQE